MRAPEGVNLERRCPQEPHSGGPAEASADEREIRVTSAVQNDLRAASTRGAAFGAWQQMDRMAGTRALQAVHAAAAWPGTPELPSSVGLRVRLGLCGLVLQAIVMATANDHHVSETEPMHLIAVRICLLQVVCTVRETGPLRFHCRHSPFLHINSEEQLQHHRTTQWPSCSGARSRFTTKRFIASSRCSRCRATSSEPVCPEHA